MANCRSSEGWVYFIGTKPGEPVKIGHTNNLEKRLTAIQNGNHRELVLLAGVLVSRAGDIEGRLHTRFEAHHLRGEWFRWSRGIGRLLKAIRQPCPYALRSLRCIGHTKIGISYRQVEVAPQEVPPW